MKKKLKSILYMLPMLSLMMLFCQCNSSEDELGVGGEINIPGELPTEGTFEVNVLDVTVSGELRALNVSWTAPKESISHYIVEWRGVDSDTTTYSEPVAATNTSLKLERLYNTSYDVTVKCVSNEFLNSVGVTKTGTPDEDTVAPSNVDSVKVSPVASSALIEWVNPSDVDYERTILRVYEMNETGEEVDVLVIENLQYYHETQMVVDLEPRSTYYYEFKTADYIGNMSVVTSGEFSTLQEEQLINDGSWTIFDFSTEEKGGEGPNNGHAVHAIDIDDDGTSVESTFWHSKWSGGGSSIPHYIVIDFKKVIKPTIVTIFKRLTTTGAQSTIHLEGCMEEPRDDTEWLDLGVHNIDPVSQDGQNCSITNIQDIRYLKVSIIASKNGHAMIRNIMVKSLVD